MIVSLIGDGEPGGNGDGEPGGDGEPYSDAKGRLKWGRVYALVRVSRRVTNR